MRVETTTDRPADLEADLEAIGLFEEEPLPEPYREVAGAGDARAGFRKLTLLRPEAQRRVLVIGLGKREELEPERMRVAAALAVAEGEVPGGPGSGGEIDGAVREEALVFAGDYRVPQDLRKLACAEPRRADHVLDIAAGAIHVLELAG